MWAPAGSAVENQLMAANFQKCSGPNVPPKPTADQFHPLAGSPGKFDTEPHAPKPSQSFLSLAALFLARKRS